MKVKVIVQILLLLIVLAGVANGIIRHTKQSNLEAGGHTPTQLISDSSDLLEDALLVTYFTTDVRCVSCQKLEALARETVESRFAEEIRQGQIRFQVLNMDQSEYQHFKDDYQLAFKTIVISSVNPNKSDHWKRMDDVWDHLNQTETFQTYLETGIREMM